MKAYCLCILLLVVVFTGTSNADEFDFFWSTSDLNDGAVNAPLELQISPGQKGQLFLWYSVDGPSDANINFGAILDVATSRPGIIRFTRAETFDFPITIGGMDFDSRWGTICENTFGELGEVSDDFIDAWGAVGPFGFGMTDESVQGPFLDEGFDADANAFLFGVVEYEVVGESGCLQIRSGDGQLGVVSGDECQSEAIEPVFGSAVLSFDNVMLGDINMDQQVNLLDVGALVQALSSQEFVPEADCNCDGTVDLLDVAPFIGLLNGDGLVVFDPSNENIEPQMGLLGDINQDGVLTLLDLADFFPEFLKGGSPNPAEGLSGDINMDGSIDLFDVCPLVDLLLAGD